MAEAVRAAADADVAVLFLGLPPSYESEGYDRTRMDLPAQQVELLHAVADANPVRYEHTPAVGAFPGAFGQVRYGEGLLIGYRWYDTRQLPVAYPFGHGLSYTAFAYSDLTATVRADGDDPRVEVTLTVTNTGERAGTETVQLYVTDRESTVHHPARELRAFARVRLEPGHSAPVTLTLGRRAFAFWHEAMGRWTVEGGEFALRVGASSRDIRLETTVELTGETFAVPLHADSTAEQWLAHPAAGPWLRELLGTEGFGAILSDPHSGPMIRAIPLARLARFPGFPLDGDQVTGAVAKYAAV
ncbi:fibronectin type III-like domain-contianing protein [Streptomyces sp. BB1-1-1]|uniref:fibronectin type III-like domain-contianing protein n=1 Tax=Streptomyces sp. BB1-1-1 TaxID=3074430 RepID=UPI0028776BC2|nr:fibronectin type III-like domain-contianing protein [Streptomyces sp. BB1-1-1]WND40530.1 fibronectin type III-like domain-contianing protein [Streptomyces sp. BB1-1-1]